MDWNFLTDDWKKIPQNLRYFFLGGVFLIFNTWLLDHWSPKYGAPYLLFGILDIRSFGYTAGFCLISFCFILLIFKQVVGLRNALHYRKEYPISALGVKFDLVWFSGKLILFDDEKKQFFHVFPWETALALLFAPYGVHLNTHFPSDKSQTIPLGDGRIIDTSVYKNGGIINTQP